MTVGAYADLGSRSDDEIIQLYDDVMAHTSVGVAFYRDELVRREVARSAAELVRLTRELRILTVAIAGATIVALAIAVVAIIR